MVEKSVTVQNPTGLHARPASDFCKAAMQFSKCRLEVVFGERTLNPKSILNVLSAGMKQGSKVVIRAEGEDEQKAVDTLVAFIQNIKE